jgi:predicted alpha/beta-hydrolase family hydrolase
MTIRWGPDAEDTVTARLEGTGVVGVLLAHGAGAGQDHPWMASMRAELAGRELCVMTFNYRYTERGKRAPDPAARLLAVHEAAANHLAGLCSTVVLAGKSMGGRIGSHLAAGGWPAGALVYLGYPLVAVGKTEPRDTSHLETITAPQLFVSGTRDRLGPIDLIRKVAASVPEGSVLEIEDGDHSLKVPKSTGRSTDEVLAEVAVSVGAWISAPTG